MRLSTSRTNSVRVTIFKGDDAADRPVTLFLFINNLQINYRKSFAGCPDLH